MENLLEKAGSFGRYQKMLILFMLGPIASLSGIAAVVSVFNNAKPQFICKHKSGSFYANQTVIDSVCEMIQNTTQQSSSNSYECQYDTSVYGVTIVTEWNLICGKLHLTSLAQTIYMFGAASSIFIGYFSDRFGRKKVCFFLTFQISMALILCELLQQDLFNFSFQTRYIIYASSQYVIGLSQYALDISIFILFIELTSSRVSMFISIYNVSVFAVGELIILGVSYYFKNWHVQNIFTAIYSFLISLAILFIVPESPGFLIANKRYQEAAKVLTKIAKFNGIACDISEKDILNEINLTEDKRKLIANENTKELNEPELKIQEDHSGSKSPPPFHYLVRTILLAYLWFASSMCYYGMTFGITSISEHLDPYMMFFFCTIAEIIGDLCGFFGREYSRRTLLIIYLIITSIASFLVAAIPLNKGESFLLNSLLVMVFAFSGKALISCIFTLIYHYASKLFPTRVRNTYISYASCTARFGAIIAPQIILLRILVWSPLPYFVFALSVLVAAVGVYFLPCDKTIKHDI